MVGVGGGLWATIWEPCVKCFDESGEGDSDWSSGQSLVWESCMGGFGEGFSIIRSYQSQQHAHCPLFNPASPALELTPSSSLHTIALVHSKSLPFSGIVLSILAASSFLAVVFLVPTPKTTSSKSFLNLSTFLPDISSRSSSVPHFAREFQY